MSEIDWRALPEHEVLKDAHTYKVAVFAIEACRFSPETAYLDIELQRDREYVVLRFWGPRSMEIADLPAGIAIRHLQEEDAPYPCVLVHETGEEGSAFRLRARDVEILPAHLVRWGAPRHRRDFPVTPPWLEAAARESFPIGGMSPEEYAAREAHNILCCGLTEMRYRDPEVEAWMSRFGDILFKRNDAPTVEELRERFLTAEERAEIARQTEALEKAWA